MKENIIFFDGYCVICDFFISTLLKLDKKSKLRFAPLSGLTAKKLNIDQEIQTVVFYQSSSRSFIKSDAVLEILKTLYPSFRCLFNFLGIILPRRLRDWLYMIISKNRYKFFKKKEFCRLPSESEKKVFLD